MTSLDQIALHAADIPFTADPEQRKRIKDYVVKQLKDRETTEIIDTLLDAMCIAAGHALVAGGD